MASSSTPGALRLLLAALVAGLALVPAPLLAAPVPGAGQLLNQVPAQQAPKPVAPELKIQRQQVGAAAATTAFRVDHIRIVGNTLFATPALHALVASGEGKELTLAEADTLAAEITAYYRDHGYPLDRAYIPAQTVKDATLTIAVVEARYGKVAIGNHSRVRSSLLEATLAPLQKGEHVASGPLDRSLLLLNDIPGIAAVSTLSPGAAPKTSDLAVDVKPTPFVTGSLGLDDYGNRYTGRARLSANLTLNNPLRWGDQLNLGLLSAGPRLNYGRLGYRSVVNGFGTVAGGSVSFLHYRLGDALKDLGAHGNAQTEEVFVSQPLVRTLASRLDLRLSADHKSLRDDIDSTGIRNNRHVDLLALELNGNHRDPYGATSASLAVSRGQVDFDDASARDTDAKGARTAGVYSTLSASLARLQRLTPTDSLLISVSGQLADKNLDSSEQFYLGGPNSVRGYDQGLLGGDEGALASVELRHDFRTTLPGFWQGSVFLDHGALRLNKANGYTDGARNLARLSSVGVGLNWQERHGWNVQASLAEPLGPKPEVLAGQSRRPRLWLQMQKVF